MPGMRRMMTTLLFLPLLAAAPAGAFTQSVGTSVANLSPMGHEFLTRQSAMELLGSPVAQPPDLPDPQDPRIEWRRTGKPGLAKNTNISSPGARAAADWIRARGTTENRYRSRFTPVLDAIIGERWVDIGGYNVLTSMECFTSVAQEAVDGQYDHFMRRWDDRDGEGGVRSAQQSRDRFVRYFIEAATASQTTMLAYDGGASNSTSMEVDRNYFLLGRAIHLLQDSFSPEHTARIAADNFVSVRQVKAYLCAPGAEQHSHGNDKVFWYASGDVIWLKGTGLDPRWEAYKPSSMTVPAIVAMEATKDLWAAFIRTMGTPPDQRASVARSEAETLAANWMAFDPNAMRTWYDDPANRDKSFVRSTKEDPEGNDVKKCMIDLKVGTDNQAQRAAQLVESRRKCLYNAIPWAGYSDFADASMDLWYSWQWRNKLGMDNPPSGWQPPQLPMNSGRRMQIVSAANNGVMTASDGIAHDRWVYCRRGAPPLDLIYVPKSATSGYVRLAAAPSLFLSYTYATGAVKLWNYGINEPTDYAIRDLGNGRSSIYNNPTAVYMMLKGESPYLKNAANPVNIDSQWIINDVR